MTKRIAGLVTHRFRWQGISAAPLSKIAILHYNNFPSTATGQKGLGLDGTLDHMPGNH
jgi:hypothetical protein